jgi:transcriptional regulator CtsR
MRLSDTIEAFIKEMMGEEQQEVEIKRNELAEFFHCAPSQINYVLSTRFTPDHGYVTSSQRGGGGYIRIVQVRRSAQDHLSYLLNERIGGSIDAQSAQILCRQLAESGVISLPDAQLMAAAVSPGAFSVPMPEQVKNALRAKIMRAMLLSIAQRRGE